MFEPSTRNLLAAIENAVFSSENYVFSRENYILACSVEFISYRKRVDSCSVELIKPYFRGVYTLINSTFQTLTYARPKMPLYRCADCQRVLTDRDAPDCKNECQGLRTIRIQCIHWLRPTNEGETAHANLKAKGYPDTPVVVACMANGPLPKPINTYHANSIAAAVTCPECSAIAGPYMQQVIDEAE